MYHVDGRSVRSGGRFGVVTSVRLLAWKTDSRGQCRAIWTWVPAERVEGCSVAGRKNWPGPLRFQRHTGRGSLEIGCCRGTLGCRRQKSGICSYFAFS